MKNILLTDCLDKFEKKLSPFDWFSQNDSDYIIVLSRQTEKVLKPNIL